VLGATVATLALVDAFLLLMTYLVLEKLLATGPAAEEERLWNNLTWDLGVFISAIGGLIVFVALRAFFLRRGARLANP